MAIGAQCKGLTAIAVPVLAIAADRTQPKRVHCNLRHVLAALLGAAIYFLPFLLAPEGAHSQSAAATPNNGLAQVLRENVVRYFAPFDHTEPFYTYFIALPQYLFPWSIVFLYALHWAVRDKASASNARGWLLGSFVLLFVFFTLSGSRRNYYILPLLPYCALLSAFYLRAAPAKNALRITLALLALLALILLSVWPLWPQLQQHAQNALPDSLRRHLFAIGLAMLAATASRFFADAPVNARLRNACLLASCIFFGGFFFRVQLTLDDFRSEAAFAKDLGRIQRENSSATIATYREKPGGELMFYAQLPPTVRVLASRDQLNRFLDETQNPKLLVIYHRYDNDLPATLQTMEPVLEEKRFPWEKNLRDKNRAWLIR
jgi:4-amino-4-deoxy-L-arabinose transferase-like glycosyltransferase